MRILRLTGSTPRIWGVDLHPRLTVIHGLAPEVAGPVRAAIDAIVRARISGPELAAAGLGGTVLVGDEEIPLEDVAERAAGLVPTTPLVGADLVAPAAVLAAGRQRALDAAVSDARAALAGAEAVLAGTRREWEATRAARAARLHQGWQARQDAVDALRAARDRAVDAAASAATPELAPRPAPAAATSAEVARLTQARVAAARAARDAAAAAVAEAEDIQARHRGAMSAADLDALRRELAQLEHEALGHAVAPLAPEADRRALAERRAQIAAAAAALAPQPTDRVVAAMAASEAHRGIDAVEAARVAVEWERVRDLVAEADVAPAPVPVVDNGGPGPSVAEADARVRAAHERLTAARRSLAEASGAAPLEPSEIEALEAAHAEVLAAWEGSERRIGVGKARRRLEEAQLAEREILARMGFASYTEFMVSGRASGLPSQLDTEEARREMVAAEEAVARAEADATTAAVRVEAEQRAASSATAEWDAQAARGRLVETLGALRARAADLLGADPGPDVAASLRDRIATEPLPDLRLALDEVGVPLGEILSRDELQVRARAWVARQEDAARKAADLAAERLQVEDELARLDAQDGARAAQAALLRRRDDLRRQLAGAEEALAAGGGADERLAHDLAELARAEAELAEAEAEQAPAPLTVPAAEAAPVDVDLAQLEAEARDAQTAIDVAVSHLLPAGGTTGAGAEAEADRALGRAEAAVVLARMELEGLERIQAERAAGEPLASTIDADAAAWCILARMASQREAGIDGGPGPAPLLVDEPFAGLAASEVERILDAVTGPASAVQVIVLTASTDALAWARAADPEQVGVVTAAAAAGYAAR